MANLDVTSLVGTWFAAIVALVALIGIIGAVLIWRASRTQRQQVPARVRRNNNGFLSKGIRAGPGIYLLVQVKAPHFKSAPFPIMTSLSMLRSLNMQIRHPHG